MGQYYKLVCLETGSHVSADNLGSFVKAYEQVWSSSQPAALAYLCSAGRGDHPRDLPWAPEGPWAGRMPLMVGDYAEDNDLIGRDDLMKQKESVIYSMVSDDQTPLTQTRRRNHPKDLSFAFLPIYERVVGLHYNAEANERNISKWASYFPAKKTDTGWELDLDDVPESEYQDVYDYYERLGAFKNTAWQRPPFSPCPQSFEPLAEVPDVIPSAKDGHGTPLLWVNLDRCEFVDPAAMGDVPDLAGVMKGMSSRSVLAMLVHYKRRGGGDLSELGPIEVAGRWRGDRIVLLGVEGFKPKKGKRINHETVRSTFLDITKNADAFINTKEYFGGEYIQYQEAEPKEASAIEKKIFAIAMSSPIARKYVQNISETSVRCRITPPVRILNPKAYEEASKGPMDLAPSFDLYINDGKVFLDAETRMKIKNLLVTLPGRETKLIYTAVHHRLDIDCPGDLKTEIELTSNHQIIAAQLNVA